MTFSIKVAGASFAKYVAEGIPSYDVLDLFLLLGGDGASSVKNHAGSKSAATVVGTPTYNPGYCTLSQANGFEGPMAVGKSPFTHMAVVSVATGDAGYCGNWTSGNTANVLFKNGSNVSLAVDGAFRASTPMSGAGFHFIAGSHDGATAHVYRGSGGSLTKASNAYSGGAVTTAKFRVGGHALNTGTFNAAAVMTADQVLSDSQILAIYGYLQRTLAERGVTVL